VHTSDGPSGRFVDRSVAGSKDPAYAHPPGLKTPAYVPSPGLKTPAYVHPPGLKTRPTYPRRV